MKRFLVLLFSLILVSGLIITGCSSSAPAPAPAPAPKPTSAPAPAPAPAPTVAPAPAPTSAPSPASPQKTWKLRMSHEQALGSPYQKWGHEPWAQDIEKATNGRVKFEIYPLQTLMKSKDALEGVKSGIADVAWIFTGYFSGMFDISDSVTLPFIAPSGEVGSRVSWALYNKYPEIQEITKDYKVLTTWVSEPYFFLGAKKFYKTIDDFKGQKIRMTGGPPTEMMKLLGGTPMMIGMPDNYLNLQKGVIDGMAAPWEAVDGYRLYEVANYFTYAPTVCVYFLTVMNKATWNEMPKDIQDAITNASGEKQSIRYGGGVFDRSHKELPAAAKAAGNKINEYDLPTDELAKWRDVAGKPLWTDWVKRMEAKGYKNASKILDDTLALVKEYSK